jgi:hypothetical protein
MTKNMASAKELFVCRRKTNTIKKFWSKLTFSFKNLENFRAME